MAETWWLDPADGTQPLPKREGLDRCVRCRSPLRVVLQDNPAPRDARPRPSRIGVGLQCGRYEPHPEGSVPRERRATNGGTAEPELRRPPSGRDIPWSRWQPGKTGKNMQRGAAMIHYHGTPITPRDMLRKMSGRHFCISFAHDQDLATCLSIGQSLMLDNGAFSAFTRGIKTDWRDYYRWLAPNLAPPHWAVIPDVIDGDVDQQRELVQQWPQEFGHLGAPVWHLALSIDWLLELSDRFPRVCLGSSGAYWQVGSAAWCGRMDEAFNALHSSGRFNTWIHGLRMLGQVDGGWPLASADSTNVAQNWKRNTGCAECMAFSIDIKQPALWWEPRPTQQELIA